MLVKVTNLRTGGTVYFEGIDAAGAVAAAYAQSKGDWNTWEYNTKHLPYVKEAGSQVYLGDFAARKDGK
jgi:hypothetical protein